MALSVEVVFRDISLFLQLRRLTPRRTVVLSTASDAEKPIARAIGFRLK